jgi:hypothetical protein
MCRKQVAATTEYGGRCNLLFRQKTFVQPLLRSGNIMRFYAGLTRFDAVVNRMIIEL